ncbi:MAG: leucine-rich repeat protein [Oscillospiraceae bacterium]|nr:leucine-rich repeat protein [Oscillospiraceae bacterium]
MRSKRKTFAALFLSAVMLAAQSLPVFAADRPTVIDEPPQDGRNLAVSSASASKEYPAEQSVFPYNSHYYYEFGFGNTYAIDSYEEQLEWYENIYDDYEGLLLPVEPLWFCTPEDFEENTLLIIEMNGGSGTDRYTDAVLKNDGGNWTLSYGFEGGVTDDIAFHVLTALVPKGEYNGEQITRVPAETGKEEVKEYPAQTARIMGDYYPDMPRTAQAFAADSYEDIPDYALKYVGEVNFEDNVLMLAFKEFGSGSIKIQNPYVRRDEFGDFSVNYTAYYPIVGTMDMATHIIWTEVPKEDYNGGEIAVNETPVYENTVKEYPAQTARIMGAYYPDLPRIAQAFAADSYEDIPDYVLEYVGEVNFEDNVLMMAFKEFGSGSIKIQNPYVRRDEFGDFSVNYTAYYPINGTADMATHIIWAEVPKEDYNGGEIAVNETPVYENTFKEYLTVTGKVVGGTEEYKIPGVRVIDGYDALPNWEIKCNGINTEPFSLKDLIPPETFENNIVVLAVVEFNSGPSEILDPYTRRDQLGNFSIGYDYTKGEALVMETHVIFSVIPKEDYKGGKIAATVFPGTVRYEQDGHTFVYERIEKGGRAVKIVSFERKEESSTDVVIPRKINGLPVLVIGESAFLGHKDLTSVVIPYGVTEIQWSAFQGCTNIERISIPESVIKIDPFAFAECYGLTSAAFFNPDPKDYSPETFGYIPVPIDPKVPIERVPIDLKVPIDLDLISEILPVPTLSLDIYVPEKAVQTYQELFFIQTVIALEEDEIIDWANLIYGDVAGEGEPTLASVVTIAKYLVDSEGTKLTATQKEAAKVTHDGKDINVKDILTLVLFLNGNIDTLD